MRHHLPFSHPQLVCSSPNQQLCVQHIVLECVADHYYTLDIVNLTSGLQKIAYHGAELFIAVQRLSWFSAEQKANRNPKPLAPPFQPILRLLWIWTSQATYVPECFLPLLALVVRNSRCQPLNPVVLFVVNFHWFPVLSAPHLQFVLLTPRHRPPNQPTPAHGGSSAPRIIQYRYHLLVRRGGLQGHGRGSGSMCRLWLLEILCR